MSGALHHAGTPRTGLRHLIKGLDERGDWLRKNYLIDEIAGPIQTVVDVGANIGDLMLTFADITLNFYLGIEPVIDEYWGPKVNCDIRDWAHCLQLAVGDSTEETEIHVSTRGSDSSLIEPAAGFTRKDRVRMDTLDNMRDSLSPTLPKIRNVDLLEIEAEGFELEIVQGAAEFIKNRQWVVVDGGPERGLNEETTIDKCVNLLISQNFSLVNPNFTDRLGVGLFKNENYYSS